MTSDRFVSCKKCVMSVKSKTVPKYGIGNFLLGSCPDVLSDLTDIEVAYISPVRVFAHLFMMTGGSSSHMKGYHSFMKRLLGHPVKLGRFVQIRLQQTYLIVLARNKSVSNAAHLFKLQLRGFTPIRK